MSFARAIATVGGLTMTSRILGFLRDLMTAYFIGAGPIADAFFVALKLPNFFRRFFAEGAMNVSFVPQYAGLLETEGKQAANRLASQTLALLLAILLPMTIVMIIGMDAVMHVLAPGFLDDPERLEPAIDMSRVTFPFLTLISVVALLGGILNSHGRFAPFAAAPVAFNLCLIGAMLSLHDIAPSPGHALSYGVVFAGILQVCWLSYECQRIGAMPRLTMPRLTPQLKQLLKRLGPAALGAGIVQINVFIDVLLASLLPTGSVSFLYYADRLNQLPLGVIGIAIGTALLPMLAKALKAGREQESTHLFSRAMELGLLFSIPAAIALLVMPFPIIGALFERGAFGPDSTTATAMALAAYATGVPAYILVKVASTGYFASGDTRTPVMIASIGAALNLGLNLLLIGPLQHVGLALGTAIAAWFQAVLLLRAISRKTGAKLDPRFFRSLPRILAASGCLPIVLGLGQGLMGPMIAENGITRITAVAVLCITGGGIYILAIALLRVVTPSEVKRWLKRA